MKRGLSRGNNSSLPKGSSIKARISASGFVGSIEGFQKQHGEVYWEAEGEADQVFHFGF